jgi:hypothetical protein
MHRVAVPVAILALLGTPCAARAAAPEDPVVIEAQPEGEDPDDDDSITFVAAPEMGDAPLRVGAPVGEAAEGGEGGVVVSTSQTTVLHAAPPRPVWWLGLSTSPVMAPIPATGRVGRDEDILSANRFRACLHPHDGRTCGVVKGFDFQLRLFQAAGTHEYPRAIAYLRTGYGAGRVSVEPREAGAQAGDATAVRYLAVPVYLGTNVYLLPRSPVRPYGGLGAGVDILRLDYSRYQQAELTDVSARLGLEVHGGLELRISNFIALHAGVMQQWSLRRRLAGVPDVSTTAFSVLAGVTFSVPTQPIQAPRPTVTQQSSTTVVVR